MDSLVGYGSDDENETERYGAGQSSVGGARSRREDDTNYDDVNMDMSEGTRTLSQESQESEPELPQAEPAPSSHSSREDHRGSDEGRDRDRRRRDRRRESPQRARGDRERRSPRRDERYNRAERSDRGRGLGSGSGGEGSGSRRGLLGDRPDDRHADNKVPALMDLKPFGGEPPPGIESRRSHDARDAVSPRFADRDRRDRDRNDRDRNDKDRNDRERNDRDRNDRDNRSDRDRERDRDRHSRRSEEKRSYGDRHDRRDRSRSRGAAFPPPSTSSSNDRRGSPSSGDYRPSSYKVNKKLEVMEKMGLQIKTPDGSMATAQQLRAAAGDAAPPAYAPAPAAAKLLHQLQKRKLLWSNKGKSEAEEVAKWSGARFAQDSDGKQACKFMRLMGIKDPAAVKTETPSADPIKKQEELFQAMQAQYDVARATTHTMRGVGLGFQRGQF